MKSLILEYKRKKDEIKKKLEIFKDMYKGSDGDIFEELCFCLLTPQSKAVLCDKAIRELKRKGLLFNGKRRDIKKGLRGVRFPNNKADYIIAARRRFKDGRYLDLKSRLDPDDIFKTREWLVENVKGLGYKEASHFLRNIGLGKDLAILDIHILRNLKRCGVIKSIFPSMSKKIYIDIENKMRRFSQRVKITLEELDLLFWSQETGFVFK